MEIMMNRYYCYSLINSKNLQRFYIGKGTGRRMYQHKYTYKTTSNRLLGNYIAKLLSEGHHIIYEKVIDKADEQQALLKEVELIKLYGRIDNGTGILCNLTDGGECGGAGWAPYQKQRKREIELAKQKGKPVSQYTLDGVFVTKFSSSKVASEKVLTANRSYITQCCKGKRVSSGGFIWCYVDNQPIQYNKKYYRQVQQCSIDGNLIETFRSLTEAQTRTNIELHNISECCRGKSKTAGGFIWKYVVDKPLSRV